MDQEPGASDHPPKPPPPDISRTTPPPSRPEEESAPPLQIGPLSGSAGGESAAKAPGSDASMGNRIIAAVIDFIIMAGINGSAGIVLPGFAEGLGFLAAIAYLLTRDSLPFLDGQSIGKKAMGIRAVGPGGKSLAGDWQPGLIRNVVFLIPFFALVELIVLITRSDKPPPLRRLGDQWARTKVVNADPGSRAG